MGSVYKKYPQGRVIRRSMSSVELPRKDIICSSQEWIANYGLRKLKMQISRYIGPICTHQKSAQRLASAKYCSNFPSIEINGMVRHIQWMPRELEAYIRCLEKVIRRYIQRLQWLLSDGPASHLSPTVRKTTQGEPPLTPSLPLPLPPPNLEQGAADCLGPFWRAKCASCWTRQGPWAATCSR